MRACVQRKRIEKVGVALDSSFRSWGFGVRILRLMVWAPYSAESLETSGLQMRGLERPMTQTRFASILVDLQVQKQRLHGIPSAALFFSLSSFDTKISMRFHEIHGQVAQALVTKRHLIYGLGGLTALVVLIFYRIMISAIIGGVLVFRARPQWRAPWGYVRKPGRVVVCCLLSVVVCRLLLLLLLLPSPPPAAASSSSLLLLWLWLWWLSPSPSPFLSFLSSLRRHFQQIMIFANRNNIFLRRLRSLMLRFCSMQGCTQSQPMPKAKWRRIPKSRPEIRSQPQFVRLATSGPGRNGSWRLQVVS